MRVGLFTHRYLEPTHYAIGQMLDHATKAYFSIFSRWFGELSEGIGTKRVHGRRLLCEARFDPNALSSINLVHAIYDGETSFEAAAMAEESQKPLVVSFHGGFDTNAKIFDHRYQARTVNLCKQAAAITVVGQTDLKRLSHLGINNQVIVLPVPVDHRLIPSTLCRDPYQIAVVGRFVAKKGIDLALKCLSVLPPEFTLTIIGDGALKGQLKQLAQVLRITDRVHWAGMQPLGRMLQSLANCGLLLHPARICEDGNAEGTPQTILWAQALGLPVVATRTGSIEDIVTHEHSGILTLPTPPALATAVKRLAENQVLRKALADGGRANSLRHDLGSVVNILDQIYQEASTRLPKQRPRFQKVLDKPRIAIEQAALKLDLPPISLKFAASGGHGHIYVATTNTGPVAVKIPAYTDHPRTKWPLLEQKLTKEARVLSEASGDGFPELVFAELNGRYLIRRYVIGETLSRVIRYISLGSRATLAACVLHLGARLFRRAHFHLRGSFLIRDFKPQNVIVPLDSPGMLNMIDAGAVLAESEIPSKTWTQERLGTGKWVHWAPEQLLGHQLDINRSIDYFSLGVSAYFCMTGEYPYDNRCRNPDQVMDYYQLQYHTATHRITNHCGNSSDLAEVILKCLEPNPKHRTVTLLDISAPLANQAEHPNVSRLELFGL